MQDLEISQDDLAKHDATFASKSDLILPPTLDTRNWKFDREEANEGWNASYERCK